MSRSNHASRTSCRKMFASRGEITPPCGVPASGYAKFPSSSTPAFSHFPISRRSTPSRTRRRRNVRRCARSRWSRGGAPGRLPTSRFPHRAPSNRTGYLAQHPALPVGPDLHAEARSELSHPMVHSGLVPAVGGIAHANPTALPPVHGFPVRRVLRRFCPRRRLRHSHCLSLSGPAAPGSPVAPDDFAHGSRVGQPLT